MRRRGTNLALVKATSAPVSIRDREVAVILSARQMVNVLEGAVLDGTTDFVQDAVTRLRKAVAELGTL
jgi:hypothetical protein